MSEFDRNKEFQIGKYCPRRISNRARLNLSNCIENIVASMQCQIKPRNWNVHKKAITFKGGNGVYSPTWSLAAFTHINQSLSHAKKAPVQKKCEQI